MTPEHHPELDEFTPAQVRVLAEALLYTMDIEQRRKLMRRLPGIYLMLFPSARSNVIAILDAKED